MPTKIKILFNASAAKESACLLRTYRKVIQGYREKMFNNDLVFGWAFHEYVKVMRYTNGNFAQATQAALDKFNQEMHVKANKQYMNSTYLLTVCQNFWTEFIAKDDFKPVVGIDFNDLGQPVERPLVELKFAWPFYQDDQVEVSLCGTMDDISYRTRGCHIIRDYKTTSMGNPKEYLRNYLLSPQFLMYRLAVRRYAQAFPDSIWDEINKLDTGCRVDGIFLRGKEKDAEFISSDVFFFQQEQLDEFEKLLYKKIHELLVHVKTGKPPLREGMLNGACQTLYGKCMFFDVCHAPDQIAVEHLLHNNFKQEPYNPLDL